MHSSFVASTGAIPSARSAFEFASRRQFWTVPRLPVASTSPISAPEYSWRSRARRFPAALRRKPVHAHVRKSLDVGIFVHDVYPFDLERHATFSPLYGDPVDMGPPV